nr:uncharacterized protein LOC109166492 [Ipomoea trifida]
MSSNRHWMYTRMRNGVLTKEFLDGLNTFIEFATSQRSWMDGERIRCPCTQRRCQNTKFLDVPTVKYHLAKHGFVSDYFVWRFHGERIVTADVDRDVGGPSQMTDEEASNAYHTMVMDAAGVQFNVDEIEESPNPEAQKFYDMLKAADQGLFPECKKHSQLSFVARLMSLKSENHISEKCFNQITELIKEVVPEDNLVPDNFYETKRLLREVGGYTIPKDTWVYLNMYAIHRDPKLWDNPLQFSPERFLNQTIGFDYTGNDHRFLPFGSGRRICAGIPLAEKMLIYILGSLLHSFDWHLPEGEKLDLSDGFGIVIKKNTPLIAIPAARLFNSELYQ